MRPKRQKPSRKPGRAPGKASGIAIGKSKARREFPRREYGRQIDADLTEALAEAADAVPLDSVAGLQAESQDQDNTGFTGAEFPEIDSDIDPGKQSPEPKDPAITQAIVHERAMRLLVHREHGRIELEKKLLQRELPQNLIDAVLDQLAEDGLQCDVRFAESYTRMRVDRGFGANKIRADLQARRVEHSVIEDAVNDSGADWTEIASNALRKKFGNNSVVSAKIQARMQRFLYQRGFESEQIRSAMSNFEATHS